jgi:serine/threonine protein phosphatase PrpC
VANSGDSRAVLSSKKEAIEMSVVHRPDLESEKKRINKAGGSIHEGRINADLNISRAIGHLEYKRDRTRSLDHQILIAAPDIKKRLLSEEDDFILMGCDGIWETMSFKEVVDCLNAGLANGLKLDRILEELLDNLLAPDTLSNSLAKRREVGESGVVGGKGRYFIIIEREF